MKYQIFGWWVGFGFHFVRLFIVNTVAHRIADNGFGLGEGGEFNHKSLIE